MVWLQPGPFTASVSTLTTADDNPTLFPNPSFTSAATNFAGGQAAGFDATSYVTLYQYDALGNLGRVDQKGSAPTDSTKWRTRTFTYDSLSRLLTATNPESGTISYIYDTDGNMLQKTSPAPNQTGTTTQTISYCYDALHRVTGKGYGAQSCPLSSPVVTYTYDTGTNAKGHLVSLTDQAGTASYSYDPLGRVISETRVISGIPKSMSYSYNLDGSLASLTYPSGAVLTYAPWNNGSAIVSAPSDVKDVGHGINYITSAIYQADGQPMTFVSGQSGTFGGIDNAFSYNKRLQPVNMSATFSTQTVFSIGYNFHVGNGTTGADNGNVWGITNYKDTSHGRDQTFTYDALNRLTSAQNTGTNCSVVTSNNKTLYWGDSYSYDAWGNLTGKTVSKCSAENLSAPALVNNQLSGYSYDAAGNMISDPTDGTSPTYDQENRITGASGYTYTYDADGNRVKKSGGATGTLYWYMLPGVVAESDLSGNLQSEYVFFNGKRVARRDGVNGAGGVFYYFADRLKTASVITDASGTVKAESDYYPWGGELQITNNDSNHYKFTGKERDETGLDYFGARYYSNGMGRFVTPDWAGKAATVPYADLADPQSLNLYSYVRNRPTVMVDPDGHKDKKPIVHTGKPKTKDLGNGLTLTQTTTTTTTFNKDGSVDVTATTTSTVTQTDPKTGKEKNLGSVTSDPEKHHIDRDTEGKIIVDGNIAPRTVGDNIEQASKVIAAAMDPPGSLVENGGHEVGRLVDWARSEEGKSAYQRFEKAWDRFWSIDSSNDREPHCFMNPRPGDCD
jgi:RHS repeat-associated protein